MEVMASGFRERVRDDSEGLSHTHLAEKTFATESEIAERGDVSAYANP